MEGRDEVVVLSRRLGSAIPCSWTSKHLPVWRRSRSRSQMSGPRCVCVCVCACAHIPQKHSRMWDCFGPHKVNLGIFCFSEMHHMEHVDFNPGWHHMASNHAFYKQDLLDTRDDRSPQSLYFFLWRQCWLEICASYLPLAIPQIIMRLFHCVFFFFSFFFLESLAVEETLSQLCSELQVIREPTPWFWTAVVIWGGIACLV